MKNQTFRLNIQFFMYCTVKRAISGKYFTTSLGKYVSMARTQNTINVHTQVDMFLSFILIVYFLCYCHYPSRFKTNEAHDHIRSFMTVLLIITE